MADVIVMTEALETGHIEAISKNTIPVEYHLHGSMDKFAIRMFVELNTAEHHGGLPRTSIVIDPKEGTRDAWSATVVYSDKPVSQTSNIGDSVHSFQTGGKSSRMFAALEHVADYGTGAEGVAVPNHKGAINVTEDRVEGTDIIIPVYTFGIRKKIDAVLVTEAYKGVIYNATGKVNGASFLGFAKGEVLFAGASGAQSSDESWEIDFQFMASPNELDLSAGDISGIVKEGWHYLWVEFEDVEHAESARIVKQPFAAHVERVYHYGDLAGLNVS